MVQLPPCPDKSATLSGLSLLAAPSFSTLSSFFGLNSNLTPHITTLWLPLQFLHFIRALHSLDLCPLFKHLKHKPKLLIFSPRSFPLNLNTPKQFSDLCFLPQKQHIGLSCLDEAWRAAAENTFSLQPLFSLFFSSILLFFPLNASDLSNLAISFCKNVNSQSKSLSCPSPSLAHSSRSSLGRRERIIGVRNTSHCFPVMPSASKLRMCIRISSRNFHSCATPFGPLTLMLT